MATADALERRSRRRGRRTLLWEAVAVLGVTAIGVLIVFLVYRHPIGSPWKVAGRNVQDISNQPGVQTEVAVAVDPSNPKVLFAASNESLEPEIRVYATKDGGRTWSEGAGPAYDPNTCPWGDPSVAIARDGRQYVAFTEKSICAQGTDLTPYLVVGSRAPGGGWTIRRVTRPATKFGFDDKPAISVDAAGRAYVAWSRLYGGNLQTTVISSSADGGRTWSKPQMVHRRLDQPQLVTIAAGAAGEVYLAGVDADGIWVGRSTNAGRTFTVHRGVVPLPGSQAATCLVFGKFVMPQQAVKCLGPNPTISLGKNRVFVTYGLNGADRTQDVAVAAFDRALRPVWRGPIGSVKKKADQFWPASTVDAATGKLWACYYDTTGDSARQHAWFVCSSSSDGRHWANPVRAAATSESQDVLWADASIGGYGDGAAYGGYPGVAAAHGTVHPLWIDTRNIDGNREEVFASTMGWGAVSGSLHNAGLVLKRAFVAPLAALLLLTAASADAGWQGAKASGATARAQAIRVVVPGVAGGATPAVSAPTDQVLFSGGFSYGEDPATHVPLVSTGSANASASASTDVEASATASTEVNNLNVFNGEITASGIVAQAHATARAGVAQGDSSGSKVTGLVALGQAVSGGTVALADWGSLTVLGGGGSGSAATGYHGSITALEIRLTADHGGLPAGTTILVGYAEVAAQAAASPPPPEKSHRPKSLKGTNASAPEPGTGGIPVRQPPQVTPKLTAGGYVFPVYGPSSFVDTFGAGRSDVSGGWHHGDDIFAPLGAPVLAIASGTVFSVGWNEIGGNRLWLRDGQGNLFYYAHLSAFTPLAINGNKVNAGDVLGFVGNTGDAQGTPTHLHFEIHPVGLIGLGYDGAVNPTTYLLAWKHLQDVSFAGGDAWAPAHSIGDAPKPGAILLTSSDISSADGLVPGSLERAVRPLVIRTGKG